MRGLLACKGQSHTLALFAAQAAFSPWLCDRAVSHCRLRSYRGAARRAPALASDLVQEVYTTTLMHCSRRLCRACATTADDQPAKPGDDGQSESSAGDGGTDTDGHSAVSGGSSVGAQPPSLCRASSLLLRLLTARTHAHVHWARLGAPVPCGMLATSCRAFDGVHARTRALGTPEGQLCLVVSKWPPAVAHDSTHAHTHWSCSGATVRTRGCHPCGLPWRPAQWWESFSTPRSSDTMRNLSAPVLGASLRAGP